MATVPFKITHVKEFDINVSLKHKPHCDTNIDRPCSICLALFMSYRNINTAHSTARAKIARIIKTSLPPLRLVRTLKGAHGIKSFNIKSPRIITVETKATRSVG